MEFFNMLGNLLSFNWVRSLVHKIKDKPRNSEYSPTIKNSRESEPPKLSATTRYTSAKRQSSSPHYRQSINRFHEEQDDYDWMDSL